MLWPSLLKAPLYFKSGRQKAALRLHYCCRPLSQKDSEDEEEGLDRSSPHLQVNSGLTEITQRRAEGSDDVPGRRHAQALFVSQIRDLCEQGRLQCALQKLLRRKRLCTTRDVYRCLLKTCILQQALPQAIQIHEYLVQHKADITGLVGDYLVVTLAKCGGVELARRICATYPKRSVFLWTSIISCYTDAGNAHEALKVYDLMLKDGVDPDHYTFVSLLKACGSIPDLERGKELHRKAQSMGYASDVFIGNTLVSMYGKCGDVLRAENVFIKLSVHDRVAYNAMLSVYVELGRPHNVLQLYRQMQEQSVEADELTFGITIQACHALAEEADASEWTKTMAAEVGRALHHDARKMGFNASIFVSSMLVTLYGKCGTVQEAEAVFSMLPNQAIRFWTIMIFVYVENSQSERALQLYRHMLSNHMHSDSYTLVAALQACTCLSERKDNLSLNESSAQEAGITIGMALHEDAKSYGFTSYVYVTTALLTMYGKFGRLFEAESVFLNSKEQSTVLWTAMLSAYVDHGEYAEALALHQHMQEQSVPLDEVTMLCVLHACSELGNLDVCRQIHIAVLWAGGYGKKVGALMHSYGNCGRIADAHAVFEEMVQPSVVCWSAAMAGYAGIGDTSTTLCFLDAMQFSGMSPNGVTFASVLSACSHSGLASEGVKYFDSMEKDYGIVREVKHVVNMTDLLGRGGNFKLLKDMLNRMPMQATLNVWLSVLGMCLRHGNVELGKLAFDKAMNLEPTESVTYILMSNICAEAASSMDILGGEWCNSA